MMEAKPLPGLPAVTTQTTRPSPQGAEPSSDGDDNFEQQLSHQLDQASALSNRENNDNNQILEEFVKGLDRDLSTPGESADIVLAEHPELLQTMESMELDSADLLPQVLAGTQLSREQSQPVITSPEPILPLAGNVLPPDDGPLPVSQQPVLPQLPLNTSTPVAVKLSPQTTPEAVLIQSVADPVKPSQLQLAVTKPEAPTELTDKLVNFQDMDILKTRNGNQDSLQQMNQSRTGISIASSVAAAASQLQQVPLTTASAHLNLAAPAFPVDSMLSLGMNQVTASIASPLPGQAWSQGLTEQVAWMVRGGIQSAEIKLNPANLGPLKVQLSIEDDVARLSFVSNHASVREALDAAMPRLRDMLEQQGISLGDVDVSQHSEQGQQSADEATDSTDSPGQSESNTESSDMAEGMTGVEQIVINDGLSIYA